MNHDKISNRLAMILIKLMQGESISVQELASEFNVSERTIYRDISERLQYLPLRKNGELWELESYAVAGKGASLQNILDFAVICGIQYLFPNIDAKMIVDILNPNTNYVFSINSKAMQDISQLRALFDRLSVAILHSEIIMLEYKGKERLLHPYKLINQDGVWYLMALENCKLKSFALSKIENLAETGQKFELDSEILAQVNGALKNGSVFGSQNKTRVVLEIHAQAKEYFLRKKLFEFRVLDCADSENGADSENLIVECEFGFVDELLNIIKAWIPYIKILEPKELDERLKATLRQYLQK